LTYPHRNHVLGDLVSPSHANIEAVSDNVRETVVDHQFNLYIRILWKNLCETWPKDSIYRIVRGGNPDGASWFVTRLYNRSEFTFDFFEPWSNGLHQAFASFSRRHAPGSAAEKFDTHPFFQCSHRMTERTLGHAQLGSGASEASLARNRNESKKVSYVLT
jgi:hypothetical protein